MPGIEISVDTSAIRQALTDLGTRTFPYIVKRALNDTGEDLLKAERESMESVFDRPTEWVLNSFYIKEASEQNLELELRPKEGGGKGVPGYKPLLAEIFGGQRKYKSHERSLLLAGVMRAGEYAVPGQGTRLDAYGNMPGGDIEQILSQLQAAEPYMGYTANMSRRSRKRAIKKAGGRYFLLRPGNASRSRDVQPGIYMRTMDGRGARPVIMFVRAPTYDQRFPYRETAERIASTAFFGHLYERFRRYGTETRGPVSSNLGG